MATKPKQKNVRNTSLIVPKKFRKKKPLVFISHDSRDAELADAFSTLLTDASGGILKSFRSSDKKGTSGIEYGTEWYNAVMTKLDGATDVVALLTPRSLDRPWLLYEAGVASGKMGTSVLGLAVGLSLARASSGPFAQFQNCGEDEDSITKLVLQLIRRNPEAEPREEAVRFQVHTFLERVRRLPIHSTDSGSHGEARVATLFEEIKIMMQGLNSKLSERTATDALLDRVARQGDRANKVAELFRSDPRLGQFAAGLEEAVKQKETGRLEATATALLHYVREHYPDVVQDAQRRIALVRRRARKKK